MRKLEKYKNQISIGITAVLILLALVGSYQYYTQYVDPVVYDRLWSTVLYSTMKLYVFSPTVAVGKETPLCYEIAKWMSPACTAYWMFRMLETLFRHSLEAFSRRFGKKRQIVVFGYNEESAAFLENLKEEKKSRIMLVTDKPLSPELRLLLEREHVLVWQIDFPGGELSEQEKRFMDRFMGNGWETVLFYPDAAVNFIILQKLMQHFGRREDLLPADGGRVCAVRCEDRRIKQIILDFYDGWKGKKPFELSIFNMPEIAAVDLFREAPLYENCLFSAERKAEEGKKEAKALMEQIPNPHLLIAGFGRYGQAVFEEALLMGTLSWCSRVSGYERLRITIIDKDISRCRDLIESGYPKIRKICDVEYIGALIGSMEVERKLETLPAVTYAAVCFEDQSLNVGALEKLGRYLKITKRDKTDIWQPKERIPIGVRTQDYGAVLAYCVEQEKSLEQCFQVFKFGARRDILTHHNVIRYRLDEEAKGFHAAYIRIQSMVTGGETPKKTPGELWEELSFEKRESNRAQVRNRPYMEALFRLLPPLPEREGIVKDGADTDRLLEKLLEYPVLDMLAAQEHRRWCNFCYCSGYVGFHPDKKEKGKEHRITEEGLSCYGKVHYCLIDDWERMKEDGNARDTVIYDVCSLYGYMQDKASGL